MALIDNQARVVEDRWSYPASEQRGAALPNQVISFDALASVGSAADLARPLGVYATAGITAEQIVPFLDRLDLVVIEFPKFRDGRGFTLARAIRGRHGFGGDIRAIGHILPDQLSALVQCGFTSVMTPAAHPPEQWVQQSSGNSTSASGGPLLQRLIGGRRLDPPPIEPRKG